MTGPRGLLGLISVALICETAVYSAITPLLPALADEHGLSKAASGALTAAYPFGTLAVAIPAAWLSARIGPKRTVVGALVALGAATLAFGLGRSTGVLVASRLLQGVASSAVWAAAMAWVAAVAAPERRAQALGAAIGAAIAGALGGPAIGAAADLLGREAVFGAFLAFPLALAVLLGRRAGPRAQPAPGLAAVRSALAEPRTRRGIWLMLLGALAFGLFNVLVPLRLDDLGVGAVAIAAVFLISVAVESAVAPVAGRLADRRGAAWPARIGLAGAAVALALLPVPHSVALVALALLAAAGLLGLLWAPAMALMHDGAEARGIDPSFGFGLANLAWGAGAALGGSAGGLLAGATTDAVPYLVLAAAALATAATLRPAASAPSA